MLKIMSDLPMHSLAAWYLPACTNALAKKATG